MRISKAVLVAAVLLAALAALSPLAAQAPVEVAEALVRTADAPLARIDRAPLDLELRRAEAVVRRLELTVEYLTKEAQRLERLASEQITSRNQLDEIVWRRNTTAQEFEQARVARDQTLDRLERTVVRAPFPGQVVERFQHLGEHAQVGGAVARLVDVRNVEVVAQAPLDVSPRLQRGERIVVRGDVAAGDRVVVRGAERLEDGQAVTVR